MDWVDVDVVFESGAVPPLPAIVGGTRVGRWELEALLGRGGMAEIWLAREVEPLHRRVVVKRMLPSLACEPDSRAMFRTEVRLGSLLRHGRIVQLLDAGEDDLGTPYLVLELVEGTDLRALLDTLGRRGERMPPIVAVHVVRETLLALGHAHTVTDEDGRPLGVVHRDVSPANILLSHAGEVKLCDFGVAKSVCRRTSGRLLKGKVRYMSPEQVAGVTVTAHSDQFSAASVLWEALTGRPRFQGRSMHDTLLGVMEGGLPPEATLDVRNSPAMLAILRRALSPHGADRFASADEFARALWHWLASVNAGDPVPVLRALVERTAPSRERPRPEETTRPDTPSAWRRRGA